MKNEFCKIIVVDDHHQVLVTKGYDSDDDMYKVHVATAIGGIRVTVSPGFKTKKQMNTCFKDYAEYNASKFLAEMQNMLK